MLITNVRDESDGYRLISDEGVGFYVDKIHGKVTWCSPDLYKNVPIKNTVIEVDDDFDLISIYGNFIHYDVVEQEEHETESSTQYVYVVTQTKLENKNDIFTASSRVIGVYESADKAIEIAQGFVETSIVKMEVKK